MKEAATQKFTLPPLVSLPVALVIIIAARYFLHPSLTPEALTQCETARIGCEVFNLYGVGIDAFLFVLLAYELVRLAVPKLFEHHSPLTEYILLGLTLAYALFSANTLHSFLFNSVNDDVPLGVSLAFYLSGAILFTALAYVLSLPTIRRGGVWLILGIIFASRQVLILYATLNGMINRVYPWTYLATLLILVVAAFIAYPLLASKIAQRVAAASGRPIVWISMLVFAPFLTTHILNYLFPVLGLIVVSPELGTRFAPGPFTLAFAVLLALILALYLRAFSREPNWPGKFLLLGLFWAVSVLFTLLTAAMPFVVDNPLPNFVTLYLPPLVLWALIHAVKTKQTA